MVDLNSLKSLSPLAAARAEMAFFETAALRSLENMGAAINANDVEGVVRSAADALSIAANEIGLPNTLRAFALGRLLVIKHREDKVFYGADLKAIRQMLGVSQDAIVGLFEITKQAVSRWERLGLRIPKQYVDKIVDFLLASDQQE